MNLTSRISLAALFLSLATSAIACGDSRSSSDQSSSSPGNNGGGENATNNNGSSGGSAPIGDNASAQRAIEEADVVQVDEASGRLFAMSKSGTLTIVDVSKPAALSILGQAFLPGEPFEMYLRGDLLVVMTNGSYSTTGSVNERAQGGAQQGQSSSATATPTDPNLGAGVIVINVKDAGLMQRVATFPVPGQIADSRVVGDILYLATYENSSCYNCGTSPRTMVTTFDIKAPNTMRQVDQAIFQSSSASSELSWGATAWKRSIVATAERMYVGGHADTFDSGSGTTLQGTIDVLDITDPTGKLGKGDHLTTTGPITSRWQMDERNGVLRVISQRGAGYATNGIGMPEVEMFNIWNTRSFQLMGHTPLKLPRQEGLKSVRFDADRAYAITFEQTDPLIIIDLKSATAPKQRGELKMPGFVFHMEPKGDRLIGLGVDRTDPQGNLNVSLFNVADMDHPSMIQRVSFASYAGGGATNDAIASYELAEDQDRIQKAFRVFESGLIVVPFSGANSCPSNGGGIQLVRWQQDTLLKGALLPMAGNPRRALLRTGGSELLAISDSNVTSFDMIGGVKQADVTIGSCELRPNVFNPQGTNVGGNVRNPDDRFYEGDDTAHGGWMCSSSSSSSSSGKGAWAGLLLGLVALGGVIRRRR